MKVRVISGIAVALIMMALVWVGGIVTALSMCGISIIAFEEMARAVGVHTKEKGCNILEVICIIFIVAYYALVYFVGNPMYNMMSIMFLLIALMVVYVFAFPKYNTKHVIGAFFSFVYVPVMLSFALMARTMSNELDTATRNIGFFAVWMIFIVAWATDTCAYFAGVTLGKHKLTPVLSPKKSVEGAIGGVLGSTLAGYLYGLILVHNEIITNDLIYVFVLLGFFGSMVAQIGDLAASAIKRNNDIKDYGKIIPGHGGIMDRFDSVIFTSPIIYFLSYFFFGGV